MTDSEGSTFFGDLVTLCTPRPRPGLEYFGGNELYGLSRAVREYVGFSSVKPLPVLIPHGVCLNANRMSVAEKRAGYSSVFSYPALRDGVYAQHGMKVIPAASPFLYALDRTVSNRVEPEGGILFFPAHSIPGVEAAQEWSELALELAEMSHDRGDVRVCLYWADVLAGRAQVFVDHGLPVVSAGHSNDSDFIGRLVSLLQGHKYAASNAMGSHFFYAVSAGCEFFFTGRSATRHGDSKAMSLLAFPASQEAREELESVRSLGSHIDHSHTDFMLSVARKYLRADAFVDRDTMREQLRSCHELDRRGSLFTQGIPSWQQPVPRSWYRWSKERVAWLLGRRRRSKVAR